VRCLNAVGEVTVKCTIVWVFKVTAGRHLEVNIRRMYMSAAGIIRQEKQVHPGTGTPRLIRTNCEQVLQTVID
jgi:hypothetical protein